MTSSPQREAGGEVVSGGAAVSPAGERFEVVGRAGPVELRGAPYIPTDAREDLLVVKEGAMFLCARPDGEVCPGLHTGEGLYKGATGGWQRLLRGGARCYRGVCRGAGRR